MKNKTNEINNEKVIDSVLEDIMGDRFGRYSKYIIQERALPDVRDGLKPVQRRIIYAMNKEGNTNEKPYRKSAKTVGIVIGNYHPHGDTSVYDAMVRMSQDWKINMPLIDMQGNNGSIDDDPAAAMRYTEARLDKISSLLTDDLPYKTVDFVPNYDDTDFEPSVLPCKIPLLLVNGSMGIAAGYATNIPPFNLNEILNAAIYRLNNKDVLIDNLMEIVKGPDFPTGGVLQGVSELKKALETGRGRVVIRSKIKISKNKNCNEIIITEIPYEVVKQTLVTQIDQIRIDKKLESIISVNDESGRDGLRIVIEVKSNANIDAVLNYLYKNTDLQVNYNFNMVSIINKKPVQCSFIDILDAFIEFRKEVIIKRSNFLLDKNNKRLHIIDGIMKAVSIMDEVIKTIRASKNKADVINNLMNKFSFSEEQADAIANMRLYRLSNTDIKELEKEKNLLEKENKKLEKILKSARELINTIISEFEDINSKIITKRKTKIEGEIEKIEIDEEKLIQKEQVIVTVSKDGYAKRTSLRSFKSSDGETGLKDGDELIFNEELNTLDTVILFTNKGNFIKIPVYKLDDLKWKEVGVHINKFAKIEQENIMLCTLENKEFSNVIQITKNGMIKNTNLKSLVMPQRFGKSPSIMKLKGEDEIVAIKLINKNQDIMIVSKHGLLNYYSTKLIPESNIGTIGLVSSNLEEKDEIVDLMVLNKEPKEICLDTESGNKRFLLSDIKKTKRGNKGNNLFSSRKSPIKVIGFKEA